MERKLFLEELYVWYFDVKFCKFPSLTPFSSSFSIIKTLQFTKWNVFKDEGAYPPRSFTQSASTRRAQPSVAVKAVRSTDLLNHNIKTWVITDETRLERSSVVKAPLSVYYQFAYICLCAAAEIKTLTGYQIHWISQSW